MTRDQQAHEAYQLAAWLRKASHDAFGDANVPPSILLRVLRVLDDVAAPVERRNRTEEHAL